MASIEHRPRANRDAWRVVWREDGRKISETFYDADEAAGFRARVEAEGNRTPRGWVLGRGWADEIAAEAGPRFADYAEQTITARGKADTGTKATYRRMLANHVTPVLGGMPVAAVTRFDVAKVSERMIDRGLSQKTVANVHALVSSILSDAVRDRIIDRNPAEGAMPKMATTKTEEMCFLSHGEFALIARHVAEVGRDEDERLARLLVGTGLRWSEATALQVHDVDLLGRRAFDVRRAWKRRGAVFELGEPKTTRSRRTIDLSAELVELLIPQVSAKAPGEFVFTAPDGGEIRHANWYHRVWLPALTAARYCDSHRDAALETDRAWRNAQRRAKKARREFTEPRPRLTGCGCLGVLTKNPRIHDLRHTCASWLLAEGVDLVAIQRRLGHESITTTIDRYSHLSQSHTAAINAAIDRALASRSG